MINRSPAEAQGLGTGRFEASEGDGACPICGGRSFEPGPKGRMAPGGAPPRCTGCRSLERHRGFRTVFDALRRHVRLGRSALQFSPDGTVDPSWFERHELSVFGGENSLDLQAIDRPDAAYDVVICNHVLEHVPDDRAALGELQRVLGPRGVLFLSVPDPLRLARGVDYGRRRDDKHGHWRLYGPEIENLFAAVLPSWSVVRVTARDPVTGAPDRCYLLSRDAAFARSAAAGLNAEGIEAALA